MAYVEHEWVNGETITAEKMNNIEEGISEAAQSGGGGYDAVIRLIHANSSEADNSSSLTPSIVSGSFAELSAKISDGGFPCILVEYYHPWGAQFAAPMAYITYHSDTNVVLVIAGFSFADNNTYQTFGYLVWSDDNTLYWD